MIKFLEHLLDPSTSFRYSQPLETLERDKRKEEREGKARKVLEALLSRGGNLSLQSCS